MYKILFPLLKIFLLTGCISGFQTAPRDLVETNEIRSKGISVPLSSKKIVLPKALVVDDMKWVRTEVKGYLEKQGFEVLQAQTKLQAMAIVRNLQIDRIITDLDLYQTGNFITSRNDGLEFLIWLSQEQKAGRYSTVNSVTLHSTIFNQHDPWGRFIPWYKNRVKRLVTGMGYTVQAKTVILK